MAESFAHHGLAILDIATIFKNAHIYTHHVGGGGAVELNKIPKHTPPST